MSVCGVGDDAVQEYSRQQYAGSVFPVAAVYIDQMQLCWCHKAQHDTIAMGSTGHDMHLIGTAALLSTVDWDEEWLRSLVYTVWQHVSFHRLRIVILYSEYDMVHSSVVLPSS